MTDGWIMEYAPESNDDIACRPGMEHAQGCGPHPSGDPFYCACGCSGDETWCMAPMHEEKADEADTAAT